MQELVDLASVRAGSQNKLAAKLGVSRSLITGWKKGRTEPSLPMFRGLCAVAGVTADWVLGISEPSSAPIAPPEEGDWTLLPLVSDQVAAGEAILDETAILERDWFAFHGLYVRHLAGGKEPERGRFVLVRVAKGQKGESMLPTVRPQALLVVDRGPGARGVLEVEDGAIYLVRPGDEGVTVRRVFKAGARAIMLWPDNPTHKRQAIELAKGEQLSRYLIGRVRWIGQEEG